MIAQLLRFALRQRFLSVAMGVALVALGFWAFTQLQVEAYPDIADTQVIVITQYAGHAAEEVEQQVTVPLERALNNTPNVIARRSRTIFGLSVVELTFDYGTNDYFARQVVLERLREAVLPDGVAPVLGPLATPVGELYRYRLTGEGRDAMQLREVQDWVVAPRMLQAAGVADVVPFGGLLKQYQIEIDPLALEKYNLSIAQIAESVNASNQNAGGAMLDNSQQSMVVRGMGQIRSVADVANSVVTEVNGVPIYVRDVATVKIGPAPQTGIFGHGSEPVNSGGAVEGIVLMRRGENPSQVLQGIHRAVDELNASRLPAGIRIEPIYDRTELVGNTLHTVSRTLLEGLVIVVGVLFLFLGSVRAALLTAITIPLSLLFAFACMHFSNIPANLLSLGALDFGIIVDGTLIMVEHIVRRVSAAPRDETAWDVIRDAALEVESPIFFSLLIIISAYIPLFTLERVERRLFTPMAFTVCYALLGSLLLALTLIPVLATYLFRHGARSRQNPVVVWLERCFERSLRAGLRRASWVMAGAAGIVIAAFALGSRLGTEFLPQLDEGTIWIRANLPAGISLRKSAEVAARVREVAMSFPEVKLAVSQSGRNDSGTDPFGPNRNEFLLALRDYGAWPAGRTKAALVEDLARRLRKEIPGAAFSFTQPIIDMVTEAVTGSSADLAVILSGPDLTQLRHYSEEVLDLLRHVPGAADTAIEQEPEQAQLRIRIDRDAVSRYGIRVRDVQDLIEMAIGGRQVSTVFEGERRFPIVVRFRPEARVDAGAIGSILIGGHSGARIPLHHIADIGTSNGATIISRRENQRQISVRTNIRGRDQGGFVADAQQRLAQRVKLAPGYDVAWGGQFENLDRARRRLTFIMPVTVAIIFTLLFFAFRSAVDAGIVLLNVPFSLVGGIVALYLRGINLSVSAAVGFISLFGVAVMGGVLVVAEINRRREEPGVAVEAAITQGTQAQMRPVLMMILVAMLGMLPAASATGIGSDVQRPLATVVVGGLLSTLLLTLFALPAMYCVIRRNQKGMSQAEAAEARTRAAAAGAAAGAKTRT